MDAAGLIDIEGARMHGWARTYTGRKIDIADPERALLEKQIDILDIAHALSMSVRFGGHVRAFYSVAQHSVLGSFLVPEEDALAFLMHDAPEAYMGDLVSPLKSKDQLRDVWKGLESRWDVVIRYAFDVPVPLADLSADEIGAQYARNLSLQKRRIKTADLLMLGREMIDLMSHGGEDSTHIEYWDQRRPTNVAPITPWGPRRARRAFLDRFFQLT